MTQLELFKKTMTHEPTGKFLFHCGYIRETRENFYKHYALPGDVSLRERFGAYEQQGVNMNPPADWQAPDFSRYFADMTIPERAFINEIGVLEVPGSAFHFTQYISPLRNITSVEECHDFPFRGVEGWMDAHMAAEVKKAHDAGLVAGTFVGHQYEDAWQIRGYEQFLMDMLAAPEIPAYILGRIHETVMTKTIAAAKAGVDVISTGDDVATQRALIFKPEVWRRFLKPLWKEVYDTARSIHPGVKIWYHSDGDISAILPELVEIGVDILNPVQPECLDAVWVKREFGKHIVLDGTIGTQTTMPFGDPAEVKRVINHNKKTLGYDGALILSPTHVLEPEVSPENIMAFYEACAEALD